MDESHSLWKFINVDCIKYICINNYSERHARLIMMGENSFDRAKSNRMDSTTQIVVKSKTKINANDESYALAA